MNYFNNFCTKALATILLVATFLPSSAQTIRRVTVGGAGNRSGSNWANASQLQAALMASTTPGDQIWIAAGTYKPHASDRTATFSIPAGVLVYGGFAGTEADDFDPATNDTRTRNAEGALTNVTILSGDLLGDDGTRPARDATQVVMDAYDATRDDNSNTVVTITGENVTLDGLTITAGRGGTDLDGTGPNTALGGAGLLAGAGTAGVMLTACAFNNNNTTGGGGGAFFLGQATLTACTFTGNEAESFGGGAHFGAATLTACTFTGNESSETGGGAAFGGVATLTNCVVVGNTATFSGGGAAFGGVATLTNCVVVGNTATFSGGGLWFVSGGR